MDAIAPLELSTGQVEPALIDYNDHMNVAYYVLAFDRATDDLMDHVGLDEAYRGRSGCSAFVVEAHVTYDRELRVHEGYRITTQVLDSDAKRVHCFHRMLRTADGEQAATTELLLLHVDARARRSATFPESVNERLRTLATAHATLARPRESGRAVGIVRRRG